MTEHDLGMLTPGRVLAIKPEPKEYTAEDGESNDVEGEEQEPWFAVFLDGGSNAAEVALIRIAWFYSRDQALEAATASGQSKAMKRA